LGHGVSSLWAWGVYGGARRAVSNPRGVRQAYAPSTALAITTQNNLLTCFKGLNMHIAIRIALLSVLPFAVTTAASYLLGSLINASFDLTQWPKDDRIFIAILAVTFGAMLYIRLRFDDDTGTGL
jgi:hypothetical protein